MKWGVRRASKKLANATTKEERDKAVATLNKHKEKATNKVNKLSKQHVQLQKKKDVDGHIQKTDIKAAKLKNRAAREENKAYGLFTSEKKAQKHLYEASKLSRKARQMEARSRQAKSYLAKNERQAELFKRGLSISIKPFPMLDVDMSMVN